ncbi:hypothetical protein EBB79_03065 [Parasedimentitalea marina]|uniref:Uncharacterized protein n=1 Tax=Parasedimentitalea marina TaxID=2483033 RepID=A0A3T0MYX8_9RHOB|nr:hypothetical protein EBB79_03065 [Parasedimentitalea marina]
MSYIIFWSSRKKPIQNGQQAEMSSDDAVMAIIDTMPLWFLWQRADPINESRYQLFFLSRK